MTIRVSSADEDRRTAIILTLRRYRSKVAEYQACRDLYNQLYPSGTQMLSDMPKAPTESYEPERWAVRRWDQRERMEISLQAMRDALSDIEHMVDRLDGDYKTVILRRYLLNESWEDIAEKLHCERTTAWRWHNNAIWRLVKLQHHATQ